MRRCVTLAALCLIVFPGNRVRAEVIPFLPRTAWTAPPEVSEDTLSETDPGVSLLYVIRPPRDPQPLPGASPSEIIPWFSDPDNAPFADWSVPDARVPANPIVQASANVPVHSDAPPAPVSEPRPVGGGSFTVGAGVLRGTSAEPSLGAFGGGWGDFGWGWGGGYGNNWAGLGLGFGNGFQNQFGGGAGGATGTGNSPANFSNPAIGQNRSRRPTRPQPTDPNDPNANGSGDDNKTNATNQAGTLATSGLTTLQFVTSDSSLLIPSDEGLRDSSGVLRSPRFGSRGINRPGQSPDVGATETTPEPATLAVFGLMALGGGLYARRRKLNAG